MPKGVYEHKRLSIETRLRISNTNKKVGVGKWMAGRKLSEQCRERMSKVRRGRKFSDEHKAKISLSLQGIQFTAERRRRMSDAKKGKRLSDLAYERSKIYHKGRPLSEEHRRKIGQAQAGSKNYNWRGGTTPESKRARKSVEYKIWRGKVFKRDNWICQDCGKRGGNHEPHHIKSFTACPELRFDVANGITYCIDCHKKNDKYRR